MKNKCEDHKLSERGDSLGYIKSQDTLNSCNDGKRSSDVLIEAINTAERLQKQLDIAITDLNLIKSKVFERYLMENGWVAVRELREIAKNSLKKIREMNND